MASRCLLIVLTVLPSQNVLPLKRRLLVTSQDGQRAWDDGCSFNCPMWSIESFKTYPCREWLSCTLYNISVRAACICDQHFLKPIMYLVNFVPCEYFYAVDLAEHREGLRVRCVSCLTHPKPIVSNLKSYVWCRILQFKDAL